VGADNVPVATIVSRECGALVMKRRASAYPDASPTVVGYWRIDSQRRIKVHPDAFMLTVDHTTNIPPVDPDRAVSAGR